MTVNVGELEATLGLDNSRFTAGLNNSMATLKQFGDSYTKIGKKLTTFVTLPIIGAGVAAVKTAADFETGMKQVQMVTEATGQDFRKLSDYALKLGADTSFSASQAAEAMYELGSAGFSTKQIMQATKGVMDFAAAGQLELASAAKTVGSALKAFQMDASKSTKVADILTKAVNKSSLKAGDFELAIGSVGAVAKMTGQSLESTTAALMATANAGIAAQDGATSIKSALMHLMKPSAEATNVIDLLGISLRDSSGSIRQWPDLVAQFESAFKRAGPAIDAFSAAANLNEKQLTKWADAHGMTTEQAKAGAAAAKQGDKAFRDYALALIFGQDGIRAMSTGLQSQTKVMRDGREVTISGSAALAEYKRQLDNSKGAAEAADKVMRESFNRSLEALGGSIETAAIKLGESLLPKLKSLTDDHLIPAINAFSKLNPETQTNIIKMAALAAAIGPVILVVGALAKAVVALNEALVVTKGLLLFLTRRKWAIALTITVVGVPLLQMAYKELIKLRDALSGKTEQRAAPKGNLPGPILPKPPLGLQRGPGTREPGEIMPSDPVRHGEAVSRGFAGGMMRQASLVTNAAAYLATQVDDYLYQASPAKKGALSKAGGTLGWGSQAVQLYALGITNTLPKVSEATERMANAMRTKLESLRASVQSLGSTIASDLMRAFDAIQTPAEKALGAFRGRREESANLKSFQNSVAALVDSFGELANVQTSLGSTGEMGYEQLKSLATLFTSRAISGTEEQTSSQLAAQQAYNTQVLDLQERTLAQQAVTERAAMDEQRVRLEDSVNNQIATWQKKPVAVQTVMNTITGLMKSYGVTWEGVGDSLGQYFASGFLRHVQALATTVGAIATTTGTGSKTLLTKGVSSKGVKTTSVGKVQALQSGGYVTQTGLAYVHKGETVSPAPSGPMEAYITLDFGDFKKTVRAELRQMSREGLALARAGF